MENQSIPTTENHQSEKPSNPPQPSISQLAAAYAKAQGQFRTPSLNRTAVIKNAAGQFLYETHYADIQECIDCIKKPLSDNGLSFTQTTQPLGGQWFLILELLHASGESKRTLLPLDVNKPPQQLGGLLTYLKRYQISAFFGLAADFDDDGNAAEGKGNVVEGKAKETKPQPKNNPPMQKALDQAAQTKPKNHAPRAENPPDAKSDDLNTALGPPMTTLEKIYAITDERGYTEQQSKDMIMRCLGALKPSTTWTVEEQEAVYKYLTITTK